MKFWAAEFKRGRKSLGDDGRSGRPKTATTGKNIAKVHQMVLDDRRIKERDSGGYQHVKRTCLSHIKSTFRHEKAVRALGAAFAHGRPKTCSNEHSNALLAQFWRNKSELWPRLITVDETWIHHYTSETMI